MKETKVVIGGRPVAKGRPRYDRRSGHFYTPRKTREYEQLVAWHARTQRVRFGSEIVEVEINFYVNRPLRGDLDNFEKAVLDGLEKGGLFNDDSQVHSKISRKIHGVEQERTEVVIRSAA